jgi:hypothetical protein
MSKVNAARRAIGLIKKSTPVSKPAKAQVQAKMRGDTEFKGAKRPNRYDEYPVSAYSRTKGTMIGGARGEDLRGYASSKAEAVSTARAETIQSDRIHRWKMGTGVRRKPK